MVTKINNTFSISRFGWLLRKDLQENKKLYLLGLVLVWGTLTAIIMGAIGLASNVENGSGFKMYRFLELANDFRFRLFLLSPFVFGLVVSSLAFSRLQDKIRRIEVLTLPASNLEKYLVRWLIVVVFFTVCYVLCFMLADVVACNIMEHYQPELGCIPLLDISSVADISSSSAWVTAICMFIYMQSFCFLGSAVTPKLSFMKSFFAYNIMIIVYWYFSRFCESVFFPVIGMVSIESVSLARTVIEVSMVVAAVINYIIAYYRFKESEVIHRLF